MDVNLDIIIYIFVVMTGKMKIMMIMIITFKKYVIPHWKLLIILMIMDIMMMMVMIIIIIRMMIICKMLMILSIFALKIMKQQSDPNGAPCPTVFLFSLNPSCPHVYIAAIYS